MLGKIVNFLFSFAIIISTMLPFIFKFFISREYHESIYGVPILIIGSIFLCLAQFLNGIFIAKEDTKKTGYTTTIAAIINALVNLILMKKYGVIIASLSTMISYSCLFIHRFYYFKNRFNYKHIYKIILLTIIYSGISYLSLLFENMCIVLILLFFFSTLLFILLNKEIVLLIG